MAVITARITVAPDGTISSRMPADQLPPGEHDAVITVATPGARTPRGKPFTMDGFPTHDEPWDGSVSLRREDLYNDSGQLA